MMIKVISSEMVKPVITKQSTTLWLSNMDHFMPLKFHMRLPFYYRSTGAPDFFDSTVVKVALSRALVEFYPTAGRLMKNDRIEICCNGEGALFVEAESDGTLDDLGDFAPQPELSLIPPVDYSLGISTYPLLLAQVTRFKCGGVCLGVAISHMVADGFSIFYFMNSWSAVSRGLDIAVAPFVDRRLLAARNPPQPLFNHAEYQAPPTLKTTPQDNSTKTTETIFSIFKLTRDQLNALKASCKDQDEQMNVVAYSTYEVLAAHVWRSVTKARTLPENQETMLRIPADGRSRMRPPLPPGYFGNAVFIATCIALCGELDSNPLKFAVQKIRESIAKMDESYMASAIDYLESHGTTNLHSQRMDHNKCPKLSISSWARFGVYDVDFGWGKPLYMGFCEYLPEGTTILLPSPTNDGSLLYAILLPKDQMQVFEKFLYEI